MVELTLAKALKKSIARVLLEEVKSKRNFEYQIIKTYNDEIVQVLSNALVLTKG
jgi:hypothetical protein